MNRLVYIFILSAFCWCSTGALADLSSFVADAVQQAPGREARRGKLFVSEFGTRFEFTAQKQKVIQIIQPSKGLFWLLFPKTKTYVEVKTAPVRGLMGGRVRTPCEPTPATECRKLGSVKSGVLNLERWVIGVKGAGKKAKVWWNPDRRMYIRQDFPDGRKMVAQMSGTRKFEGLFVEQWKMTVSLVDGTRHFSYMLFAPELGFPVMEQGSKGLVKELHNIKPHEADAALYKIPVGYKKVSASDNSSRKVRR